MKTFLARTLLFFSATTLLAFTASAQTPAQPKIETELKEGVTTVKMQPLKISGPKDEYHSLHLAVSFTYPGTQPQPPEHVAFEIHSIVKRHTLNSDLYIVFLIEDETVFLNSKNRSAVKNPFPGRKMIGERIEKKMPVEMYLKLAKARKAAIKMGGTVFELTADHKTALLELAKRWE